MIYPYVNMHNHSEHSTYDGAGDIDDRAWYAAELDQLGLGLSDHGVLSGLYKHGKACKKYGIKPAYGLEGYYQPQFYKPEAKDEHVERFHLSLFAMTQEGLENIFLMTKLANLSTFYHYPIITDDLLRQFSKGIALFTGCISGFVPQMIIKGEKQRAKEKLNEWMGLFQDNCYLEVMPHNIPNQRLVNETLLIWADLEKLPFLLTEDSHFVHPKEYKEYQTFIQVRKRSLDLDYSNHYMHSQDELERQFEALMETDAYTRQAMSTSGKILEQMDVSMDFKVVVPKLPWMPDNTPGAYTNELVKLVKGGLRSKNVLHGYGKETTYNPGYKERIEYELNTFADHNFLAYILMIADIARYAKEQNILITTRGSACASLVLWALDVTTIDPVFYKIPFERFCGPERKKLPDVDLDVQAKHKDRIVAYIQGMYPGAAQICTFGRLKTRSIVNQLVKIYGMENGDAKRFLTEMEKITGKNNKSGGFNKDMLFANDELLRLQDKYNAINDFLFAYNKISYIGTHPAGIAVADNLLARTSIMRVGSGDDIRFVTAFDMEDLEEILVKVDALGLSTLDQIDDTEKIIGAHFLDFEMDDGYLNADDGWVYYDVHDIERPEVMQSAKDGDVYAIFQAERVPEMYKKLQPQSVADMALITALDRPGPMQQNTFDQVLDYRNGIQVTPIFGRPIVYQEDIQEICRSLAGLTWEQTELIIKALKHAHTTDKQLEKLFVGGLIKNKYKPADSALLWQSIQAYTFNMPHAFAYGQLANRQLWLRFKDKVAFYTGVLRNENSKAKRRIYEQEVFFHGIGILLPDINGGANYEIVHLNLKKKDGSERKVRYIQQGLSVLDDIGPTIGYAIEQERLTNGNYTSIQDLQGRPALTGRILTSKVMNTLLRMGTLDFNMSRLLINSKGYWGLLQDLPRVGIRGGYDDD